METLDKMTRISQGINKWRTSKEWGSTKNGWGTVVYPTGFGKTLTGLEVLKKISELHPNGKNIVLTPSDRIKRQWIRSINNYFAKEIANNIRVITPTEEVVYPKPRLLIIDELHKFTTEQRYEVISNIDAEYGLGLTATYYEDPEVAKLYGKRFPVIDVIPMQTAIDNNWISKFIEFNLGIDFDESSESYYTKWSNYMKDVSNIFDSTGRHGFEEITRCYVGYKKPDRMGGFIKVEAYDYRVEFAARMGWSKDVYDQELLNYSPMKLLELSSNYYKIMRYRLDLINLYPLKLDTTINAIKLFDKENIITFSQSTTFADRLAMALPDIVLPYHSKIISLDLPDYSDKMFNNVISRPYKGAKLKDKIISLIANPAYAYRVIAAVKSLSEGFNLDSLSVAVNTSGDSNPIGYKQKRGRVIRVDNYNPNKTAIILNIYIKNTIDRNKLISRQYNNGNIINWIDSLDEIDLKEIRND